MKKKAFVWILVIVLFFVCFIIWYLNFPGYKNVAEDRINTYMKAQKVDLEQGYQKGSSRDFKTGRWMIVYKFSEEPNLIYEYEYDRNTNSVLLIVFESPTMKGGRSIQEGMNYPSLEDGWSKFDSKGKLILNSD